MLRSSVIILLWSNTRHRVDIIIIIIIIITYYYYYTPTAPESVYIRASLCRRRVRGPEKQKRPFDRKPADNLNI